MVFTWVKMEDDVEQILIAPGDVSIVFLQQRQQHVGPAHQISASRWRREVVFELARSHSSHVHQHDLCLKVQGSSVKNCDTKRYGRKQKVVNYVRTYAALMLCNVQVEVQWRLQKREHQTETLSQAFY